MGGLRDAIELFITKTHFTRDAIKWHVQRGRDYDMAEQSSPKKVFTCG